jgi:uncharacterized RDD family membrane protein YckC
LSLPADFLEDYEVLTVETPENLELRLPLAGFGPRFLAQLVDNVILGVVGTVVFIAAIASSAVYVPASGSEEALLVPIIIMILLLLFVTVGYYALFESLWNGQTPGKRLTGIRVVRRGGLPLTFREVALRNLIRLVDWLPSYGFAGLVSFFATRNQQRLGDLAADTVVIREFSTYLPHSWLADDSRSALGGPAPAGYATSMLSPRMAYVLHSYLSRATLLSVGERLELTERMIGALGYSGAALSLREREDYLAAILQMHLAGQR